MSAASDPAALDPAALDPAALSVLIARLSGIADEIGAVLQRGAFSPNIKERADCSAAVFDASGAMLAQAEHIPVHLGSMPASVTAVIEALGELAPGEQAIVNDPFAGGTHLNDITVVAPCWYAGELVGWVANRAHHADVGGAAPGSLPADATDVHQEGLRLPPVLLTDEVRQLVISNSRTPWERAGDLDAQIGANAVGVERLAALAGAPFGQVVDYGQRRARAAIAALADGEWRAQDHLDSTGSSADQQRPALLCCTVRVHGDEIELDFAGSDAQRPGNTNAVRAVTLSSVAFALRSVIDPTLPGNAGTMIPVTVRTEPGSIVDARYPAAVGAGNVEVSQRIVDVVTRALAQVVPHRVPAASQGTMNNLLVGGLGAGGSGRSGVADDGTSGSWVYYETVAGGQGGRPPRPGVTGATPTAGMNGVHTGMTNTRNTPIEALERSFPMRVLRYRLRSGSGGTGAAPGGEGVERDLLMLEDVTVSLITERRVGRPWGLAGGGPGAVGENWLLPGGDESRAERLPDKCTVQLKAGDVLRMLTPGGGGWGPPAPSSES
jgi:N-methylhydantoinase B/oxoprolinase/acetone carboxylase alpha subunit